ncbi:helix-turn-helix domain-containing protein [Halobacillus salinarum]|uniref:Helix-turn-helix domain-containing protein n=1 Tax=Halobacillus salinarum TaxID=2932257 RepID=A0ABY4EMB7_9BACI|nr:helix-turn-helix transcriptional regulator [Halobacillus salinarum]UOQ45319.1 helix-turn-helix domain-containing protein [Halobacillus salinarum]
MGISGRIIKYVRKEKGVTQEWLAEGICSISYLSKVENETLEPSSEILDLLGERLGIAQGERRGEQRELLEKELFHWYHLMKHDQHMKAAQKYIELSSCFPHPIYTELNDYYDLFRFRFEVAAKQTVMVNAEVHTLMQWHPHWTGDRHYLASKMLGFYYHLTGEHHKALDYFLAAEQQTDRTIDNVDPELFYYLAVTYLEIGLPLKAISNVQESLQLYHEALNEKAVLKCKLLLAESFHAIGDHEEAHKTVKKILALQDKKEHAEIAGKAYLLSGTIAVRKGNAKLALDSFYQALTYLEASIGETAAVYYGLARAHYELGEEEQAISCIQHAFQETSDTKQHYRLYMLHASVTNTADTLACMNKLEYEILPYFLARGDREDYLRGMEMLAEIFLEKEEYRKSAMVYREAARYRTNQYEAFGMNGR